MRKLLLILAGLGMSAVPALAQTTHQIVVPPYLCVDQTSFYCATPAPIYGFPITIDGQAGLMIIDLFGNLTSGYVSVWSPSGYFNNLMVVPGPLDETGHISSMQIADKSGYLVLNLDISWEKFSSGGGRGSHNVIWRPRISGSGNYTSF